MKANLARPSRRAGFTLLELLIVISILAILFSFIGAAFFGVRNSGHIAAEKTRSRVLHDTMKEMTAAFFGPYISTSYSAKSQPQRDALADPAPLVSDLDRRKALEMVDEFRSEFPQEFRDFTDLMTGTTNDPFTMSAVRQAYIGELQKAIMAGTYPAKHNPETQSAACLYLILKLNQKKGIQFSFDQIENKVKDTDGDGMLEIVDQWDKPVRFYRWPVDLYAYLVYVKKSIPKSGTFTNIDVKGRFYDITSMTNWFTSQRSNFENDASAVIAPITPSGGGMAVTIAPNMPRYFRLHKAYPDTTTGQETTDPPPVPTIPERYPVIPMIISAGPDGEFGLHDNFPVGATQVDLKGRCGRVVWGQRDTTFKDNIISFLAKQGESL